jgi:hypothetical protein
MERDREEWTDEDERHPKREEEPLFTPDGVDAALGGIDDQDPDIDPEIAEEVSLQEETREAEEEHGPIEDAAEDPADKE